MSKRKEKRSRGNREEAEILRTELISWSVSVRNMKTLLTFALLALIGLLHHNSAAPVAPGSMNEFCCPNVTRVPVPKGKIQDVVRSHSKCPVTSIIVTTVCETKICLDGSWTWAKKLMTEFEKLTANHKNSPSAPFNVLPCTNQETRKL